jgi:hypothetical protein
MTKYALLVEIPFHARSRLFPPIVQMPLSVALQTVMGFSHVKNVLTNQSAAQQLHQ